MLGLAHERLGADRRAGCTTACTSRYRAHLYPRSAELRARGPRTLGALGATISGAGPTVLVWVEREQTGAALDALAAGGCGVGRGDAVAVRVTWGGRASDVTVRPPGELAGRRLRAR